MHSPYMYLNINFLVTFVRTPGALELGLFAAFVHHVPLQGVSVGVTPTAFGANEAHGGHVVCTSTMLGNVITKFFKIGKSCWT